MPTEPELAQMRARTAWWLKVTRLADPRKPTLAEAAVAAGLSKGSGSVVSLWEDDRAEPSLQQLRLLARFYSVPINLFTEPPETDEERLVRYRQLALAAIGLAHADLESGLAGDLDAAESPGSSRDRRSA